MVAFRKAIEFGAQAIETDLHVTKDGHFVAIHDSTLERTTNGRGRVCDHSLAELQKLEAGLWFDRSFAGERVPTLEQIIAFGKRVRTHFFLELKYSHDSGVHRSLIELLTSASASGIVTIICFDAIAVESIHNLDKELAVGLLTENLSPDPVALALSIGAKYLCPRSDIVSRALVDKAHASSLQLATWTVDRVEKMKTAISLGVDGIMSDFPDRLRDAIDHCDI